MSLPLPNPVGLAKAADYAIRAIRGGKRRRRRRKVALEFWLQKEGVLSEFEGLSTAGFLLWRTRLGVEELDKLVEAYTDHWKKFVTEN